MQLRARNPPGTWFERSYPGAQFGCPVNFGTIGEDELQFIDNLFWTRGRHDVKVGVQTSWTRSSGDFRNCPRRPLLVRARPPVQRRATAQPPVLLRDDRRADSVGRVGWSVGMFAQDNWRITDAFALNLGVRYDLDGSLTALNPLVRIDRGTARIDADLNNVAPRVGFAWTPCGTTSERWSGAARASITIRITTTSRRSCS